MKFPRSSYAMFTTIAVLASLIASCSKGPTRQPEEKKAAAKPAPSVPNVKVTPAVQERAATARPGPKATKKATADTFGKGRASITVKGHPGGANHSFWTEELDVDRTGKAVEVNDAWDNRHKVLYVSTDRTFTCGNGQTASGSTLMVVYGEGNTLHKPTGSGWWVAELDQGNCGVDHAGIYGCRFDVDGNNTDCGSATVHSEEDDVVIVPFPGTSPDTPNRGVSVSAAPRTPVPASPQIPAAPSVGKH